MSYKWNLLLRSQGIEISLWHNFKLYMVSSFAGLVLPSTVGADLVRTYQLAAKHFDSAAVLASIVLERFLGFLAVSAFTLGAAIAAIVWLPVLRTLAISAALITLGGGVLLVVIFKLFPTRRIKTVVPRLLGDRLTSVVKRIFAAFEVYRMQRRVLVWFFILSVVETLVPVVAAVVLGGLLGIELTLTTYLLVVPFILLLMRIPITLNGIGVVEGAYVFMFGMMGVAHEKAFSLGLTMDVLGILLSLAGGAVLLIDLVEEAHARVRRV
jgi:uncharacterized protein (TIRG00374 family)